jgi:hypothetical protein
MSAFVSINSFAHQYIQYYGFETCESFDYFTILSIEKEWKSNSVQTFTN